MFQPTSLIGPGLASLCALLTPWHSISSQEYFQASWALVETEGEAGSMPGHKLWVKYFGTRISEVEVTEHVRPLWTLRAS